ncbi:MAG: MoxR family ATPase [Thaumarchaeota archaeon]|nr:MoxR family ATPase [Nitrososphaerota archaeon]
MDLYRFKELCERILKTVGEIYVGNELLLRKVLCAALANGHVLFEDYPGLGKTLLAKVFAKALGCKWTRIQFTPDLMPADIIGTKVWKANISDFVLERGPIFTNILLADEINRAPPKTQSALLEAMEERQVTIEGVTYKLEPPFFVIATQNPIELEGTYPLPEAQMDRFLMRLSTGYVDTLDLECEILRRRIRWQRDDPTELVEPVVTSETFREMQRIVETDIYVDDQIIEYIAKIVRSTREHPVIEVGSSPRGGLSLLKLARAHAAMCGRDFVVPDDVKMFVYDALNHRLILNPEYVVEGKVNVKSVIDEIVSKIEVPKHFLRR